MANRVTTDDILRMNKEYFDCHSFAEVARRVGFSASTVSKYVDRNWSPANEQNRRIFNPDDMPKLPFENYDAFKGVENFGDLCILSDWEKDQIKELWNEMEV